MFREVGRGRSQGGSGGGKGRKGGPLKAGPNGDCFCPKCNYREPHRRGEPCKDKECPQCGTLMVRE